MLVISLVLCFSHFAGVGGYYYLLEPLWWVGMITSKLLMFFLFLFFLPMLVLSNCFFLISIIIGFDFIQSLYGINWTLFY